MQSVLIHTGSYNSYVLLYILVMLDNFYMACLHKVVKEQLQSSVKDQDLERVTNIWVIKVFNFCSMSPLVLVRL